MRLEILSAANLMAGIPLHVHEKAKQLILDECGTLDLSRYGFNIVVDKPIPRVVSAQKRTRIEALRKSRW